MPILTPYPHPNSNPPLTAFAKLSLPRQNVAAPKRRSAKTSRHQNAKTSFVSGVGDVTSRARLTHRITYTSTTSIQIQLNLSRRVSSTRVVNSIEIFSSLSSSSEKNFFRVWIQVRSPLSLTRLNKTAVASNKKWLNYITEILGS